MRFSPLEIGELAKAWLAVSVAFAILYNAGSFFSSSFFVLFGICTLIVGSGFLLHELAHKFLVQHYGCWAEFRADNKMLLFMLAVSFFGFIFAAPGGVFIKGHLTKERHGKIAFAGPFVNLLFAVLFLALTLLGVSHPLVSFGLMINSWLALFNLLPVWQFDGLNVWQWNKSLSVISLLIAGALAFFGSFLL